MPTLFIFSFINITSMIQLTRFYTLLLLFISCLSFAQTKIQSPKDFLGYELGERFTRHHEMRSYYEHVAATNSNVKLVEYGTTNEYRPLFVAIISSPENMNNLENIRLDNIKRTGLVKGSPTSNTTAIVWLSYNVHGNESSSLDASIKTIYELVNPENETTKEWLKNTVVIMDPCINPDGRERYVNHFYEKGNAIMNTNGESKEHREPWPGGRANHYLFDLNRDWAWQTQVESQQRIKLYNQWMPHIHVDFHEQSYRNPYYFAPGAKPFHEIITSWQREFQTLIGKNNAKYFDKEGWLYFTKESFDLLYPSYGDTYPTYNGAIGMTYEQGGGGYAGLGIATEFGDTLTLKDRLIHHYTTGLSTIEITSSHAKNVVNNFASYFKKNVENPADNYKSYVIKVGNQDKTEKLLKWLDDQQIRYGSPNASVMAKGFDYKNNKNGSFKIALEDIVISSYQPKSTLVQALFEPKTKLEDSVTYDITAWAIPYVYGLEAYATSQKIATKNYVVENADKTNLLDKSAYAYVARYESLNDLAFVTALLKKGINVRVAKKPFKGNGESFNRGSIVITRRNNEHVKGFKNVISEIAKKHKRNIYELNTGFVDSGADLGASSSYSFLKPPKVALLGGDKISSLSFGEIWHFFDKEIQYPLTTIYTDYFNRISLENYDVLIIPNIRGAWFTDDIRKKVSSWVSNGGNLVLIGNAINGVADKEGFSVSKYANEQKKKEEEKRIEALKKENILAKYGDLERKDISNYVAGAIYKVYLDDTHPLAFGYPDTYFTLKTGASRFSYLPNGGNVGVIKNAKDLYSGFIGENIKGQMVESLVFGVESKGRGKVTYLVDNPLFRDFWENGKLLFGNAVFLVD